MNLTIFKEKALSKLNTVLEFAKEESPMLFLAAGAVSVVAGVVVACNATLKADSVLMEHKENMDKIRKAYEVAPEKYTTDMMRKDKFAAYVKTIYKLAKLYLPAAILVGGGITMMVVSHNIVARRLTAMTSAYTMLGDQFAAYRENVVNTYGKDADIKMATLKEDEIIDIDPETGEETVKKVPISDDKMRDSTTARYYVLRPGESPEEALAHLLLTQRIANDIHRVRSLTLNEVYNMIDPNIPQSDAGLVLGWKRTTSSEPTKYINFGINGVDFCNETLRTYEDQAWNEGRILLDFNVDKEPLFGRMG